MSMDMNQAPAEEWWRRLEAVLAQGFSRCVLIARERAIDGTSFDFHTNKFFSQVTRVHFPNIDRHIFYEYLRWLHAVGPAKVGGMS